MKFRLNLKAGSFSALATRPHTVAALAKVRAFVKLARERVKKDAAHNKARAAKDGWSATRKAAEQQKLDLFMMRVKLKANAVYTKHGLMPLFEFSATELAGLPAIKTPASTGGKVVRPYLDLFKIHGFSQSLLDVDPKAALAFKPSSMVKLADDIGRHVNLFSGDIHKRVGVTAKNLPTFLGAVEAAGYPVAPFGFEKLDPKLKAALGTTRHSARSVVSTSYMFTRHRNVADGLLVEFATYLQKLSSDPDSAASLVASIPLLSGLPPAKDSTAWRSLAEAYLGSAFGDTVLFKRGMSALPRSLLTVSKVSDIVFPKSYMQRVKQEAAMTVTFMLHRLLASLLYYSKKEKWAGDDKKFVDRMVNAYATILVSASTAVHSKNLYPTVAMVQVFYMQSKTADSILAADGIKTKLSVLMKPYVAIPSVRALFSAAPAAARKAQAGAATFQAEKPLRLTAAKLGDMTQGNLAWMLANDPLKLLKLYGDSPQFDLDFSALRAREMAPLVKFLASSHDYAINVPEALHKILHRRWRVPDPSPRLFAQAYSQKAQVGLEDVARIAAFGSVSTRELDPIVPKLTKEASQYLVLQLVAKSATAVKGAFGKISDRHASLNQIANVDHRVLASEVVSADADLVRANFKEAQKTVDSILLDSGIGAVDMTDLAARVKVAYKEVTKLNGKMVVTSRAVTDADLDSIASHMTLDHRIVAFRVDSAFKVTTKAKPSPDGGRTVERVWHGTDQSAASCIALTGFKVSRQNIKAGRSMGSVVYVAPNSDKSMQYLGDRFNRNASGILFTGPAYVKGKAQKRIDSKSASPYDWTHTARFATEEIGLVNANVQFGIEAAYSVATCSGLRMPTATTPLPEVRRVAGVVLTQLLTRAKAREAQTKLSATRTLNAIQTLLRSYNIHIAISGPKPKNATDYRVFQFVK